MNARNNILKLITSWELRDPSTMDVSHEWSSPHKGILWRMVGWQGEDTEAIQAVIEAGTNIDYHAHPDDDELILIVDGRMDLEIVNKSYTLTSGQSISVPRGMLHRAHYPLKTTALLIFQDK